MFKFHGSNGTLPFHVTILGNINIIEKNRIAHVLCRGDPRNGNITRNDHDLALLRLRTRANLNHRVQIIRLPTLELNNFEFRSVPHCVVSGFGIVKDNRPSYILKYLSVPIVGRDEW